MPVTSRWLIRSSFVYLLVGFFLGSLLLINKAYPLHPVIWSMLPVHIEILIFGWIIQLTLGTAYWILPRLLEGSPRGSTILARLVFITLNAGILLNVLSFLGIIPSEGTIAGRMLEVAAVIIFIALHWKRVVSYRN